MERSLNSFPLKERDMPKLIDQFKDLIQDYSRWIYKSVTSYVQTSELYQIETTRTLVETFNKIENFQLEIEQITVITTSTLPDNNNQNATTSTTEFSYILTFKDVKSQKILLTTSIDSKNTELSDLKDFLKTLFEKTKQEYDNKQTYWKQLQLEKLIDTF